jgi:hypothetical protein
MKRIALKEAFKTDDRQPRLEEEDEEEDQEVSVAEQGTCIVARNTCRTTQHQAAAGKHADKPKSQ